MKHKMSLLLLLAMMTTGCQSPAGGNPTGNPTSGAKTTGTMVVPNEANPAIALAPVSVWQLAQGYLLGLPAQAFDASMTTQFQATLDGTAVDCQWDNLQTTASGDVRARFNLANTSSVNNAELIFRSPSGSIKLATFVERIEANVNTTVQGEVNTRTTASLLVARAMAANGKKPIKSYTQADFQAIVNAPKTTQVETSLKAAFSSASNKGQDTWSVSSVAQVTASVALDLQVNLGGGIL